MNSRILLGAVGVIVVLVTGTYFVASPFAQHVENKAIEKRKELNKTEQELVPETRTQEDLKTITTETKEVEPKSNDEVKTVVPSVKPVTTIPGIVPSAPIPAPVVSPYTSTEVAKHSGESSCWSIINGNVYDLTAWISQHPGGDRNILRICGKDGTAAFSGQHGGDSKPETTLAKFYLGALTN